MNINDPQYKKMSVGILITLVAAFAFIVILIIISARNSSQQANKPKEQTNAAELKAPSTAEEVEQILSGGSKNDLNNNPVSETGNAVTSPKSSADVEKILNGGKTPAKSQTEKTGKINAPQTPSEVENILNGK